MALTELVILCWTLWRDKDLGDTFHACCRVLYTQDEFHLLDELQLFLPRCLKSVTLVH